VLNNAKELIDIVLAHLLLSWCSSHVKAACGLLLKPSCNSSLGSGVAGHFLNLCDAQMSMQYVVGDWTPLSACTGAFGQLGWRQASQVERCIHGVQAY